MTAPSPRLHPSPGPWLGLLLLLLGAATFVVVWSSLALVSGRQHGWMALLAALQAAGLLRLGRMRPGLARALLAAAATELGVETLAHDATSLAPEYGTLVPMRYMNQDQHFKVISVSALCTSHYLNDSVRLGWAMRKAVEEHYDGTVAFLASGSLSHRFAQNGQAPEFATKIWSPFLERLDRQVIEMWQNGEWQDFCAMLPEYAVKGHGEGFMHDTAMLLGALGWSNYDAKVEVITPYFGASGTGQINALFPVTPQADCSVLPPAQASAVAGGRL